MPQHDFSKKDVSDFCIWLADALKASDGISVNWRIFKKFTDDFESDNNCQVVIQNNAGVKHV